MSEFILYQYLGIMIQSILKYTLTKFSHYL